MSAQLEQYAEHIAHPILFDISPETSLARWEQQRAEGFDYSFMCEGLEPPEDLERLKMTRALYKELRVRNPEIVELNAESSKDRIAISILEIVYPMKSNLKNEGQGELCTR